MTPIVLIALIAAGFIALFSALYIRQSKINARRREGYLQLAESRGLDYEHFAGRAGQAAGYRFADPRDGTVITVTRPRNQRNSRTTTRTSGTTLLTRPDPRVQGGMAVYLPKAPEGTALAASSALGMFDNPLGKMMMGKLLGDDIARYLGELQEQPVPGGLDLTIMANFDPAPMLDPAPIARSLQAAPEAARGGVGSIVIVTENGVQLRVARDLNEPEEIAQLLDAAAHLGEIRLGN